MKLDVNGKATVIVDVKADATTEGAETLNLVLSGGQKVTADVTVNDTSLTPAPVAKTFTLTTGVDTGAAFVGTAAADQFFATDASVNLGDSLDGGTGSDKLTVTSAAATAFPVIKTVGIETYEIQALVTGA